MKKTILIIILVVIAYCGYAQNTFPSSGNVGIGTTSPNGSLQIIGPLDGSIPNLEIGDPSPGNTNVAVGTSTGGYNIDFHTWRDVVPNQIGARIRAERINNWQQNNALVQSMDLAFYTSSGFMQTNLSEKLRITSNGYVGIGTTSPNSTLDIRGYVSMGGGSGNLDARGTAGNLSYLANSGQMVMGWNRTQGAGEADFISNQSAGEAGGFAFYNHDNSNNETQLMWLLGNGNLLIGKNTQTNSSYKLDVAGSVRANAITVNTSGADFVFEHSYHLMPLADVLKYVNDNHHLPGIASAKQMQTDGLNLGDNQTKLLQKVEELTLYLIEKDEKIDFQQKEIDAQKTVNSQLSDQLKLQQEQLDQLKTQLNILLKSVNK